MPQVGRGTGKTTRKLLAAITAILRNRQDVVFVCRNGFHGQSNMNRICAVLMAFGVEYKVVGNILSVVTLEHKEEWKIKFFGESEWERDREIIMCRNKKAYVIFDFE